MHGVYKYESNDRVIYVGKTDSDFSTRIACHRREEAFAPYLPEVKIFVKETRDAKETDFLETLLINQFKPELNSSKKRLTDERVCATLDWISWEEYLARKAKPRSVGVSCGFYLSSEAIKKLDKAAKLNKCSKSKVLDTLIRNSL